MAKKKSTPQEAKEKVDSRQFSARPRWVELLCAGDYRTARAEAAKSLTGPSSTTADKAAAEEVLARTGFDRAAVGAGIAGVAVLAAIVAQVLC